jgi:hypothetical protein
MPCRIRDDRFQTRFLLRGSGFIVTLLLFWWFVLLNPMLSLLRVSAEISWSIVFGGEKMITELPSGGWSLRVPVESTILDSPQHRGPMEIHSIEFDIARSDLIVFTFSLPVYWAIVLAAPEMRRSLRPLILGTILMAALEIVLFLAFAEINAHHAAAQWSGRQSDASKWFLRFGDYLVVSTIPYAAPFIVVLSLHRGLRRRIFQQGGSKLFSIQEDRAKRSRKQRRRAMRQSSIGQVTRR